MHLQIYNNYYKMDKCLCIPRVNGNTTESQIRKIFNDLKLGVIDRVEVITKTNERGEKSKRAFIHFKQWLETGNAITARERFALGKDIKVMYNEPWFWKVSTSTFSTFSTFRKGGAKSNFG